MISSFSEYRCSRRTWLRGAALTAAAAGADRWLRGAPESRMGKPALTDAQADALRGVLAEAIARRAIPGGALVVLSRGQVVFREAAGQTAFDGGQAFAVDTPCFIASVTKPISATFFTLLDERGVVSLDAPVEKFLSEFKGVRVKGHAEAKTPLRVWHLLAHRSGLPGNADMGDARPHQVARGRGGVTDGAAINPGSPTLEGVTKQWIADGLLAEPGARFAYGSSGYMVAARIAEVVLGKRFETLLEETLLTPLAMRHTSFHPDAATARALPARYQSTANGAQRDDRTMPLPDTAGLINPAGGLCSRLDDLAGFVALHLEGGLIGEKRLARAESLARMYRPHPPRATETADGGGIGYGLGWNAMAPGGVVRHLGASGCLAWVDLQRQHAGVLLTQVKWGPGNRPLIPRLMKEVSAIFSA